VANRRAEFWRRNSAGAVLIPSTPPVETIAMIASVMTICVSVKPRCWVVVLLLGFIFAITSDRPVLGPALASAVPGSFIPSLLKFLIDGPGRRWLVVTLSDTTRKPDSYKQIRH